MTKVLITGAAGFIGYHLVKALAKQSASNYQIWGIDNLNSYYDPSLKRERLNDLGFSYQQLDSIHCDKTKTPIKHQNIVFQHLDISDKQALSRLFFDHQFSFVIHLAAQAGVRHSIDNPQVYIDSNLVGFANILEACRQNPVRHLVFASSSSVYGMNTKQPFSTDDSTDFPISLYAATKKANEVMAHCYSHLYHIPTTGLRFFTVYGPYGRPDMAYFKFTKAILENQAIEVFNKAAMKRDMTYIDDVVAAIQQLLSTIPTPLKSSQTKAQAPFSLYNLGNNQPVSLKRFISAIEAACAKKAKQIQLPMQAGDVPLTYADIDPLVAAIGFRPKTSIEVGMHRFVRWYQQYQNH